MSQPPRTSSTHPLLAPAVPSPTPGQLRLTFAPGRVQPDALSGPWSRDLRTDIRRLKNVYGTGLVVSIIEAHDLRGLKIPDLAGVLGEHAIRWIHITVPDGSVPAEMDPWIAAIRSVRAALADGQTVVVHCKGGLGRTGMFAASVLATYGGSPEEAIGMVRRVRPGAIETPEQEAMVAQSQRDWDFELERRFVACLLGGAVGDALGAPVEFHPLAEIRRVHGPNGVRDYTPAYGRRGAITDDTQMTLFTAEALLRARDTSDNAVPFLEQAYARWLWTQGDPVPPKLKSWASGFLFEHKSLHEQRAPGGTCLSALRARVRVHVDGTPLPVPLNDSKGCGGVMRVAPIGLVAGSHAWELGCAAAKLTHEHPAGYDSAGLFAEILAEIVVGHPLRDAVHRVWARRRDACCVDTQRAIDAALALVGEEAPPTPERLETLGGGWVGEEALAISLYCALACPDLESAVQLAVTHSGDSDSTGAIVGNTLGAAYGVTAIPERWLEELELRNVIGEFGKELGRLFQLRRKIAD